MSFRIQAITLDLDDTLWPFAPIGVRLEQVLDEWLRTHSPRTAERFPGAEMQALHARITVDHPHLAHDLALLRRMTLQHALTESGDDAALAEAAYQALYAARNEVTCYPDSCDALARIAACVPVAALTNGNADLQRIGLSHHFLFQLRASEHGVAKPDASIFLAACERLGYAQNMVLHVGDHAEVDILAAARAGLRTCWINRCEADTEPAVWTHADFHPDLEFTTLTALADWLEASLANDTASAVRTATA